MTTQETKSDGPAVLSSVELGVGALTLLKLDGHEVAPGVWLVGEPTPLAGTDKLRGLAEIKGCLCVVELRLRFLTPNAISRAKPAL